MSPYIQNVKSAIKNCLKKRVLLEEQRCSSCHTDERVTVDVEHWNNSAALRRFRFQKVEIQFWSWLSPSSVRLDWMLLKCLVFFTDYDFYFIFFVCLFLHYSFFRISCMFSHITVSLFRFINDRSLLTFACSSDSLCVFFSLIRRENQSALSWEPQTGSYERHTNMIKNTVIVLLSCFFFCGKEEKSQTKREKTAETFWGFSLLIHINRWEKFVWFHESNVLKSKTSTKSSLLY